MSADQDPRGWKYILKHIKNLQRQFIQIAGPKNIQNNAVMILVVKRLILHNWKWPLHFYRPPADRHRWSPWDAVDQVPSCVSQWSRQKTHLIYFVQKLHSSIGIHNCDSQFSFYTTVSLNLFCVSLFCVSLFCVS